MEIASVFIALGLIAFAACVPQFIKLVRAKKSDQFSVLSWTIWFLYQVSSLVYAISIGSMPYIALNILWVGFYAAMLGLIIYYRRKPA